MKHFIAWLLILVSSSIVRADEAFPPHQVYGNLYYVGSKNISSYLVATDDGHIIINSGFEETVPLIRASVQALGFKMKDVKILLASHAHSDHVAGHALLQEITGAKVFVMKGDDNVIRSGGKGQYLYTESRWRPCPVDRILKDMDEVKIGGMKLIARRTPGHTRGCTTWTYAVKDGDGAFNAVIVGSPNVNPGYQLVDNKAYPKIADDYAKGFAILKATSCDIFLGAHGKYYGMLEKYEAGKKSKSKNMFRDQEGYKAYIAERHDAFLAKLAEQKKAAASKPDQVFSGIDSDAFDTKVRPQDDLFMHVNGRWMLETEIPGDKSNYGSFVVLIDKAQARIRTIIEDAAKTPADANGKKVGDFFNSYMNEELVEKRGIAPLAKEIAKIAAIKNKRQVIQQFGYNETNGVGGPLGFYVDQDDKDSTRYIAALAQSGTTLPVREYYLEDDPKYVKARAALKKYIVLLFILSKQADPENAAHAIVKLETELAKVQWSRTELRDANKRYNLYQVDKLSDLSPKFDWNEFFTATGVKGLKEINVNTPSFFKGLDPIVQNTSVDVWKQYFHFRLLDAYATVLPKDYSNAHFELHMKELTGIPEQKPRWKRAVDATSGSRGSRFGVLGDAVGQLYVKRYFKEESKTRMDQLVGNLLKSFEKSVHGLAWMTDATKKQALVKLSKITPKIGYPERWRDYSGLQIDKDDLVGNMMRSSKHEYARMLNKLGKPVDRTEWGMTPQTVNAYYNPGMNEIVFPAAILQPPFFNADADDAVNYGGIGAVIGHEISHAFDDQGSKYDGDGNLKNWWTDDDRVAFEKLTTKLVDQYESYEALPGKKLNGRLTLGENIADLSGMAISYKAYRISLGKSEGPVIDGYTSSQRFFLGWGQIWRRKYRDAELIRRLVIDPHSPSHFRSNGPVTNLEAFYKAFKVKRGDKLFKPKKDRIQIW
jgi:putative endopeptidase